MNKFALIAAAGFAGTASAQLVCITVDATDLNAVTVTYEIDGTDAAVAGNTALQVLDAGLRFTGGTTVSSDFNPTFAQLGPIAEVGLGTADYNFQGTNQGFPPFGAPSFDNPILVGTFVLSGDVAVELVNVNSIIAFGTPGDNGFGEFIALDANNTEIKYIPAPATAGLLGLGGLAAARRRR